MLSHAAENRKCGWEEQPESSPEAAGLWKQSCYLVNIWGSVTPPSSRNISQSSYCVFKAKYIHTSNCDEMKAVLSNLTRGGSSYHMCPVRSVSILQCIVISRDNAGIGRGESVMLLKCAENQNIWIVAERCSRLGGLVVVNCVYWLFMTNNCYGRKWVIINLRIISQH